MTDTKSSTIESEALAAFDAGLSVYPPAHDGSKKPGDASWEHLTRTRLTRPIMEAMYRTGKYSGLGVFTGRVFQENAYAQYETYGIECLEFDDKAAYAAFLTKTEGDDALRELIERIRAGYEETTPGGGIHWLYYCETVGTNTVLAARPRTADEQRHKSDKTKVLIETRGMGGWVITAPSSGAVHPSGKPYVRTRGGFGSIATITTADRQRLFEHAATFDQMPARRERIASTDRTATGDGGRPGDDFNQRGDWSAILTPHGWHANGGNSAVDYWLRPGAVNTGPAAKDATVNADGTDRLWVWSTSATPFETGRYYDKFGAFALLNHHRTDAEGRTVGDLAAAAAALKASGYGVNESTSNQRKRFTLYTVEAYRQRPRPSWLIKGVFHERSLAMLYGSFGTYKSFITLDMLLSVACGLPWQGYPTKQAPTAYVIGEGGGLILDRVDAWLKHHGISEPPPSFYLLPEPVQMRNRGDVDSLLAALAEVAFTGGLFALDTLARTFGDGNENLQEDMNGYVNAADRVKAATDSTGLIVHHTNREGAYRGSNVLPGAIDTMIEADKCADGVTLKCAKQKDREPFRDLYLKKVVVALDSPTLDDGTPIDEYDQSTSLVFVNAGDVPTDNETVGLVWTANRRKALETLRDAADEWTATGRWESATRLGKSSFNVVRNWLVQQGYVATKPHGVNNLNKITETGVAALMPKVNPFARTAGEGGASTIVQN